MRERQYLPEECLEPAALPPGLSNPVWLYVPANLNIPASHRDAENEIHYWLHTIIVGQYSRKHDLDNTTRVNRQTIRRVLHPTNETKARKWLLNKKIIYTDHSFVPGERSKAYGLNPKYQGKVIRWKVTNPTITAKINHHRLQRRDLKDQEATRSTVFAYLEAWAKQIRVHSEWCDSEDDVNYFTVEQILNGEIDFFQDEFGQRIHSPFTRLFTPFRDHLHFQGQSLVNNDIRNSQLVFFLQLLLNQILSPIPNSCTSSSHEAAFISNQSTLITTHSPSSLPTALCCTNNLGVDVVRFKDLVEQGTIYDELLITAQGEIPEYLNNNQRRKKQRQLWQELWIAHAAEVQPGTAKEWREERKRFQHKHRIKAIPVTVSEVGRSEFKQMFFADVFFGRNQVKTPLTELFLREFPTVFRFIQGQKRADYKALCQKMQRAESKFVIDIVCRRLMEYHQDIPVITIHDSIMTTREHAATVKRIMDEEFQRMGIKATVRTDGKADGQHCPPNAPCRSLAFYYYGLDTEVVLVGQGL